MNDYEISRTKIHKALKKAGMLGDDFYRALQEVHMAMNEIEEYNEYEWEANRIEEMFDQVDKINDKLGSICYKLGVFQ